MLLRKYYTRCYQNSNQLEKNLWTKWWNKSNSIWGKMTTLPFMHISKSLGMKMRLGEPWKSTFVFWLICPFPISSRNYSVVWNETKVSTPCQCHGQKSQQNLEMIINGGALIVMVFLNLPSQEWKSNTRLFYH